MEKLTGHWKKLVSDPKFLGAADLEGGPEIGVTVDYVTEEMVKSDRGTAPKTVVHFCEPVKPMVLNVTNSKTIAKLAGSPMVEKWAGTKIQVYFDPKVRFAGDMVGGVRVRPFPPKPELMAGGPVIQCEKCGGQIKPYGKMDVAGMAAYTQKAYGKKLCADCATVAAKEKVQEEGGAGSD